MIENIGAYSQVDYTRGYQQGRADAIDECFNIILNCKVELHANKWHMIQLQEAMEKILQLKEKKDESDTAETSDR